MENFNVRETAAVLQFPPSLNRLKPVEKVEVCKTEQGFTGKKLI